MQWKRKKEKENIKASGQDPSEAQRAKAIQRPPTNMIWRFRFCFSFGHPSFSISSFSLTHSLYITYYTQVFKYIFFLNVCVCVCMDETMEGVRKCLYYYWKAWPTSLTFVAIDQNCIDTYNLYLIRVYFGLYN